MSRRGLSDIVTMILIVLTAMAAIVLIWNFVQPLIGKASGLDADAYTTKLSVSPNSISLDPNTNLLSLNINRDAGDGDLSGFIFGLEDPQGNVKTFRQNITLSEFENKKFQINYSEFLIDDVLSVTITPIFRQNGTNKETLGIPIQQPVKNKTAFALPSGYIRWTFENGWSDETGAYTFNPFSGGNVISPYTQQDKFGSSSASFGGASNDYLTQSGAIFSQSSFTVIAWIKPSVIPTSPNNNIIGSSLSTTGFRIKYQPSSTTTQPGWNISTNGPNGMNYAPTVPFSLDSSWHFIAGVYTSSNPTNISLNYDGTFVSSSAPNQVSAMANIKLGGLYNGYIDELLFFNRNLSAQEIDNIRRKYKG